jgi:hypothetical protein
MKLSFTRTMLLVGLFTIPIPAEAYELNGGISMGGILAGVLPRFAVTPHAGISWRTEGGFQFDIHDMCAILLSTTNREGIGFYNKTLAAVGYAWATGNFSAGPSLSVYRMHACGATHCGHVVGLSPGGQAQASIYFADPLGASISVNVDWIRGKSIELPDNVAGMILVGPIIRWSSK